MKRFYGFTLIELMVVIVILGILSAVIAPRIPKFINKAKEGKTKGNLGNLRSAINIYYADNAGNYPVGSLYGALIPKYLGKMPPVDMPDTGHENSSLIGQVLVMDMPFVTSFGFAVIFSDQGKWTYCELEAGVSGGGNQKEWGDIWISCSHTDTASTIWSTY